MAEYKVELLLAAWQDIERIADQQLVLAGAASAKRLTDSILDTLDKLSLFPYMGALHPDPVLSLRQYRKVICGIYVCIYKVVDQHVYVYRIVNGKTDYPSLLK